MPEHVMSPLEQYTSDLFAPEDEVLGELRAELPRRNIPSININAVEGRQLQVLLRAVGARRVLELGALGGYSGIWIARALPEGGKLITMEINPHHAATAREFYARAGVADKVELREGAALDLLPALHDEPPFDAAFLDADKANQARYVEFALELVRPGGLILCDNSYRRGSVLEQSDDPDVRGVQEANRILATHPRLYSTIIPAGDGLAVAVVGE